MRFAWTIVATMAFWLVAVYHVRLATLLVPVYCFAVVMPYGVKWCERRWTRYRQRDVGPS
jgi:hypothetical protein